MSERCYCTFEKVDGWWRNVTECGVHAALRAGERDKVIEECAKVADEFNDPERVESIVAAIRALKRHYAAPQRQSEDK